MNLNTMVGVRSLLLYWEVTPKALASSSDATRLPPLSLISSADNRLYHPGATT